MKGMATVTTLANVNPNVVNSLDQPDTIQPVVTTVPVKDKAIVFTAAPYSLTVLRVPLR
jgi:hypothetical protein